MRSFQFKKTFICIIGLSIIFQTSPVKADVFTFIVDKQEEKKQSRWSLADWLDQRDRMRMMDLWLALHSPSPYEFYIGGEYRLYQLEGTGNQPGSRFIAAAYASIFGLEFQYQNEDLKRWLLAFKLRIFGYHAQGTNITLEGGVRTSLLANDPSFRNPFAGIWSSIYILKFFGIDGGYRYYFDSTPSQIGVLSGSGFEVGAFIDFSFIRLYGSYYGNSQRANGVDLSRTGVAMGTKIFF
ncbi:MAG: hypothetical protein CL678_16630 [Bdellovibrionaceae bacterium]|nr:hypothetical protein [Pseudobdellovibrionaceae bacterium]